MAGEPILPIRQLALIVLVLLLGGCGREKQASGPGAEITIFAASSLREVVEDVAAEWSRRGGQTARLQFEASSTLARQIREGADADVFLSAAPEWTNEVPHLGRQNWLRNELVLVVRSDAPGVDLQSLSRVESLALAPRQVPVGKYAHAALAQLGINLPERTIYGSNVRDVLSKVSQGGAEAGIVYATDAAIDPEVRISFTFPTESHPAIVYSAAQLSEQGGGFFEALQAPWAIAIARRYGFRDIG